MSDQLERLRKHTKEITDIMLVAQSSFKIVDYVTRERKGLEMEVINQNQFLKYTGIVHFGKFVIDLSKLFADRKSEHFNLPAFIRKFKKDQEFYLKEIDETAVNRWEQTLETKKIRDDIKNLILQRDKVYGHTDKEREHVKNELSYKDAKELLSIVQMVVNEIHLAVFGDSIFFDPIGEPVIDLKRLVNDLVNKKKLEINFLIEHCRIHKIDPKDMNLPSEPLTLL